jgi:hypothetical protein
MTTAPPTTPRPRRRWLRFSLRTLLALMLAFGAGFGWFAHQVQRAREQGEAGKALKELGGMVAYQPASGGMTRTAVAWVGKFLGEDLSVEVRAVSLWGTPVTDAGLEHLRGLTQLQVLSLDGTPVTNAGLEHLRGLTQLQVLDLDSTHLTDAGLEHLRGLTQLKELALHNTPVTDAGLGHLRGLTQLQVLTLTCTRVTDAGLEHLRGLTQLQLLNLFSTAVTDAGVNELKKALPNLTIHR